MDGDPGAHYPGFIIIEGDLLIRVTTLHTDYITPNLLAAASSLVMCCLCKQTGHTYSLPSLSIFLPCPTVIPTQLPWNQSSHTSQQIMNLRVCGCVWVGEIYIVFLKILYWPHTAELFDIQYRQTVWYNCICIPPTRIYLYFNTCYLTLSIICTHPYTSQTLCQLLNQPLKQLCWVLIKIILQHLTLQHPTLMYAGFYSY